MTDSTRIDPTPATLTTADGLELFARHWKGSQADRGAVAIVHGLGEHAGRYCELANRFVDAGYEVFAHDQRGYGRSPRHRWPQYEELLDDLELVVSRLRKEAAGRPCFLVGQSFGGNLVLNLALRREPAVAGVVAASPMLRLARPPAPWKLAALRTVSRIWPTLPVHTGIQADQLTLDTNLQEQYRADPLVRRRVALGLARAMIDSGEWAAVRGADLALPSFVAHGDADQITSFQASREFALANGQTRFHAVDAGRHELLHSGDHATVEEILAWMDGLSSASLR